MSIQKNLVKSDRLSNVKPSAMRKLFEIANELRAQGKRVLDFGLGDLDIKMPEQVQEGLFTAVKEGKTSYGSNAGEAPLREKISEIYNTKYHLETDKDDIICTCGASESLFDIMLAFVNPGDEVLIHEPSFPYFGYHAALAGGKTVPLNVNIDNKFKVTAEQIQEVITEKTKAIVLNYPTNPTGAILERSEVKSIVEVCEEAGILVIADECYERIYYDNKVHVSPIEFGYDRVVSVNSFSKSFCMTGMRLGYTVALNKEILAPIAQVHQYAVAHATKPVQYAALAGLNYEKEINKYIMDILVERREKLITHWKKIPGMKFDTPEATFYLYPNIADTGMDANGFCEFALRNGVVLVPGTTFGVNPENKGLKYHFRLSYGIGAGKMLEDGANILIDALDKL